MSLKEAKTLLKEGAIRDLSRSGVGDVKDITLRAAATLRSHGLSREAILLEWAMP